MTWPEDRKLVELERKLSSIQVEFSHWLKQSEEQGPLPKHHTQIRRVTRQLGGFTQGLSEWLEQLRQDQARLLQESRSVELQILQVHRVWEFYRSKLSQRYVDWLRDYLVAVDELAWACYNPARAAADPSVIPKERVKEPPLVFLNGGWSPFASSRGVRYEAEWVPGEGITEAQLEQILKDLPIPVIGVPWYQVRHLPDAVVIGHEVGHNVEDDFGLTSRLRALLRGAMEANDVPEARHAGWRSWLGELFADLYGVLAVGPAFVSGLMDFLALSPAEIMTARQTDPDWLDHPPDALRVTFNLRALEILGCRSNAATLRAAWSTRFPHHDMEAFESDIKPIVLALLRGPYEQFGGAALTNVLSFGSGERAQAEAVKLALRQGLGPAAPTRPLIAGTRLAFEEDPAGFVENAADKLVLKAIVAAQTMAVRGEKEARDLDDYDEAAGHRLLERIRGSGSAPASPSKGGPG